MSVRTHIPATRRPERRARRTRPAWAWVAVAALGALGCDQQTQPGLTGPLPGSTSDPAETTVRIIIDDGATMLSQFDYADDSLLVQLIPSTFSDADEVAQAVGASLRAFEPATQTATLSVQPDQLDATAARLAALPEVEGVEKDYRLPLAAIPNDPRYVDQWHLPHVGADAAWDITTGNAGLIIAIIDTGVDINQPDLHDQVIAGWNVVTSTADPADCCGHGTQVAGTAAAIGNNALGVTGMAWSAAIMPIRVASFDGTDVSAQLGDIADGIVWAVDHGASVINLSFTGILHGATIRTACQYAVLNGRVVVAAAGNTGIRDEIADSPWVISVGAVDNNDILTGFSTFGPAIDLAAPGVDILATARFAIYLPESGTSFASPLVAGTVALMRSIRPEATPSQIADLLTASTVDLGTPGRDELFGYGRLDAGAAVRAARDASLPSDNTPPTPQFTAPADGARLSGKTRIEIDARDDTVVREVALAIDGQTLVRDTSTPFAFLVDPQAGAPGIHEISVTATDLAGNVSPPVSISVVFELDSDAAPPEISALEPASGSTLRGRADVTARLTDAVGLDRVMFLLDGAILASQKVTGRAARIEFNWNASAQGVRPGTHVLNIIAHNQAGRAATATININTES